MTHSPVHTPTPPRLSISAPPVSTWRGLRESDIPLLDQVQKSLLAGNTPIPDWRERDNRELLRFRDQVRQILIRRVDLAQLEDTTQRIADALSGIGLLQPFLRDREIEEVYVRGPEVAVEKGGEITRLGYFAPPGYWEALIRRVAEVSGQRLSHRHPAVLVDLPGGQRFTGMLPPLMDAPAINIRQFGVRTTSNLREMGTFDQHEPVVIGSLADIADPNLRTAVSLIPSAKGKPSPDRFLAWMVASQAGNILVSGEFSSGKTTLLNFISQFIPPDVPVAILETFRELQLADHLFQMRAIAPSEIRAGDDPIATMDWVLNVVYTRSNPGVIVLGEIVSRGEAMQFLKAANLGRRAYATIHGFDVRSALARLEQLALGDQPDLGLGAVREMVAAGVDIVVHMSRVRRKEGGAHRFVADISRVAGLDERGSYQIDRLYSGWLSEPEDPIRSAWEAL